MIGEAILRLYDQMIAWTVIDRSDDDRHGQRLALAYYFGKIQRVTRLALTGILTGQGLEAMPLLRDQYDFTLRFEFYKYEPHEALLFALTQSRLKVRFAEQIMEFDERAASDPRRIAQLQKLRDNYAEALRQHPDLMRPTKKSANTPNPIMVPWSEPEAKDLSPSLMQRWYEERAQRGEGRVATPAFVERVANRTYFYRATAQSQSRHGTAFNIDEGIAFDRLGNLDPVDPQVKDPNGLAFLFLENAMPQIKTYCDLVLGSRSSLFEERLQQLMGAFDTFRSTLGIPQERIPDDPATATD